MKKDEYIARYGIKKYEEYLEYCRNRMRRSYQHAVRKGKPVDNIEISVTYCADYNLEIAERNEEERMIASKIQKAIRSWWSKQTDKKHIIVVTAGNVVDGTGEFPFRVELTQLGLQEDEISLFKVGAADIVRQVLEEIEG